MCNVQTLAISLSLSHVRAHTLLPPTPSILKTADLIELTHQKTICKVQRASTPAEGPAMSPGRGIIGDVPGPRSPKCEANEA
jgi:hypothetical protein